VTAIQELRSEKNVEYLRQLVSQVENEEKEIEIPDRNKLFTDTIQLQEEPDGNICINGQWVHPIYGRIVNQINNGETPMIAVVGKEGLGKSMTALRIMIELHENINVLRGSFDIENQVVYKVLEYLFLERQSTRTGIMFEEANETLNSNNYQSKFNHSVAASARTQRKRENPKLFVGPEVQQFDSRIRDKLDIVIELKNKQFAEITTYQLKHGKKGNRGLDYYFNNDYPDWAVPDVPENRIEKYDEIDNQFKGSYLDEMIMELVQEKIKEMEEEKTASI